MKISNIGMLNRKGMVCSTLGLLKGEIVWMGGNDRVTEGVWSWTGGKTSWSYTNWKTGTCTLLKFAVSFCTDTIDSTHLEKFIHADEIFHQFFGGGRISIQLFVLRYTYTGSQSRVMCTPCCIVLCIFCLVFIFSTLLCDKRPYSHFTMHAPTVYFCYDPLFRTYFFIYLENGKFPFI